MIRWFFSLCDFATSLSITGQISRFKISFCKFSYYRHDRAFETCSSHRGQSPKETYYLTPQVYGIVDQTKSLDASLQRIRWLASGKRCNARMQNVCTIVAVTSCTNIQQHFYVCKSTLHNKLWGMQFGRLCVKMEQGYHGKCNIYVHCVFSYISKKKKKKKKKKNKK